MMVGLAAGRFSSLLIDSSSSPWGFLCRFRFLGQPTDFESDFLLGFVYSNFYLFRFVAATLSRPARRGSTRDSRSSSVEVELRNDN